MASRTTTRRGRPASRRDPGRAGGAGRRGLSGRGDADTDADAALVGARFSAIYAVVRQIPRGRVVTYGQVAELAGLPGAARVVGRAMQASAPDLGLPWQRVVGKRGPQMAKVSIHDPIGAAAQRALLEAEGVAFTPADGISLRDHGWIEAGKGRAKAAGKGKARAKAAGKGKARAASKAKVKATGNGKATAKAASKAKPVGKAKARQSSKTKAKTRTPR